MKAVTSPTPRPTPTSQSWSLPMHLKFHNLGNFEVSYHFPLLLIHARGKTNQNRCSPLHFPASLTERDFGNSDNRQEY